MFSFFGFWVVFQLNVSFLTRLCIAIHSLNQLFPLKLENVLCIYPFNVLRLLFSLHVFTYFCTESLSILLLFILVFFLFTCILFHTHTHSLADVLSKPLPPQTTHCIHALVCDRQHTFGSNKLQLHANRRICNNLLK